MNDKHIVFLMTLVGGMALFTGALFLAGKGINLSDINLFRRQNSVAVIKYNNFPNKLVLASPAFSNEGQIPKIYTCLGNDINPPFTISGIPEGSKSLVLIMEDPDAPYKTWVHWLVYNIDPRQTTINENTLPWNSIVGKSDFGIDQYRGPCPPIGKHKYTFTLYALDIKLTLEKGASKKELTKAMAEHILDQAIITASFEK